MYTIKKFKIVSQLKCKHLLCNGSWYTVFSRLPVYLRVDKMVKGTILFIFLSKVLVTNAKCGVHKHDASAYCCIVINPHYVFQKLFAVCTGRTETDSW
jgi:hypothetical protein